MNNQPRSIDQTLPKGTDAPAQKSVQDAHTAYGLGQSKGRRRQSKTKGYTIMAEQSFEETLLQRCYGVSSIVSLNSDEDAEDVKATQAAHEADKQAYALEVLEGLRVTVPVESEVRYYSGHIRGSIDASNAFNEKIDQAIAKVKGGEK